MVSLAVIGIILLGVLAIALLFYGGVITIGGLSIGYRKASIFGILLMLAGGATVWYIVSHLHIDIQIVG